MRTQDRDRTISEIMKEYNMNLTQIANKTGLSIPYICKLKNNQIIASEQAQQKIYNAFGFYVVNEQITYKIQCEKMMYELYKKEQEILSLQVENTRLKQAIINAYKVVQK